VGVRTGVNGGGRAFRADLVIGADGRNAITRKLSGLAELSSPQGFDVLWCKVPFTERYPDRSTGVFDLGAKRAALAYVAADGEIQVGFVITKGDFSAMRARGDEDWTEELIDELPEYLGDHLREHRKAVADAMLLNVISGRLTEWSVPGLLLVGDAAHPMSPVGGQGVNMALRDALVAANHLVPILTKGSCRAALDAAARAICDERWPEIVAAQKMQEHQAKMLFSPDSTTNRIINALLPMLLRTGLLQWLNRREYRLMSQGAVPVRLTV
jgi:2-polyprenyl-6-methoxyphenol hydroxylase-like FAD-dependent oxidoreductase